MVHVEAVYYRSSFEIEPAMTCCPSYPNEKLYNQHREPPIKIERQNHMPEPGESGITENISAPDTRSMWTIPG